MEFLKPGGFIICDGPDCDFADLAKLVGILINDLIIISTFIATGLFVYAGFRLLISGGDEGAMRDAKAIIGKVIRGYIVILTAWLVVYTITHTLLKEGYSWIK